MVDCFNSWSNWIAIVGVVINSAVAYFIYKISYKISASSNYQKELEITKMLSELPMYKSVILTDVKKYKYPNSDENNKNYYQQGVEIYTITPAVGVNFILGPSEKGCIKTGLVPFEWIEYIRLDGDSQDTKPIIVCKFKGVKYYKKFNSPFSELYCMYVNSMYNSKIDPPWHMYTAFKRDKK